MTNPTKPDPRQLVRLLAALDLPDAEKVKAMHELAAKNLEEWTI